MSEVSAHLEALEDQKFKANEAIEFAKKVARLLATSDFREVIMDEFCVKEAARYVQNSANPALTVEQRADCLGIAQASGHLKRWLAITQQMAENLKSQMPALDAAIESERAGNDVEDNY